MVDENLTDEQQAERIRQWFRENGLFMLGSVGMVLAGWFGWDQWQAGRTQQAEEASGIYEELVGKIRLNNQDEADLLLTKLVSDYGHSPYINHARFRLAKMSLDRSNFEAAAGYLDSVVAGSDNNEILQIARIRLARVRLQQEQYEAALAALAAADAESAFYAQVNDVRGDIYFAMGRAEEARSAYDAALTDMRQPPSIDRAYVQAKRESLPVGDSVDLTTATGLDTSGDAEAPPTASE